MPCLSERLACMMKCGETLMQHPLRLLEVEGIVLETYDVAGLTPLHKAVGFGHPGCLRRLLENGRMDPNICTGEVTIPADFEPAPSRYETALHVASRLLTRAINSPDGAGSSEQQQEQQREIMQILVDYGADPTAKDINGVALSGLKQELLRMLRFKGRTC